MTGKEKLNAMDSEELAKFLAKSGAGCGMCAFMCDSENCLIKNCVQGFKSWLESEVENG